MATIQILGLGSGELAQLPLGVYRVLQEAMAKETCVYLRTKEHPVVQTLCDEGLRTESFDDIYEQHDTFEAVYQTITEKLIQLAKEKCAIIYAVPGHPMVAEKVVQLLLEQEEIHVEVVGGKSFIDDLVQAVNVDMINGFQLVDALDFKIDELLLTQSIMIMQVFNAFVASEVKLSLMERYPDDYMVALVHAAGTTQQKVDWVPLFELDQLGTEVYNLTTVFVPAMKQDDATKSFVTLQTYMDAIAQKDIWLREQTHHTLIPYLKEETQEFVDAVERDDIDNMIEELGDLLWQVLFHTSVAEQDGYFNLEDVLDVLNRKIRRRHPHVFDGVEVNSIEELDALWQSIKKQEKQDEAR